eukprot:CAMPEP_0114593542 /NCGR_PEP_ID=MMETSP0125-20121206/15140_1 /TAXON_ID=485358 ORGANISM="Aristerostoma sp., Strain ATCC 50986" /NCGR_SAMPLE_ID=MMETSP0125 /ASSEMBLY_ACC=CAM_ASM_000245 /LENGTH=74 /DNA_ID=CAMNT_0001792833 /DNA_START=644 /DNA_END=868 /DNA_ORIENTATION=-
MVCLFNLKNENEEEAAESIIVLDQPIQQCRFFNDSNFGMAYAVTTANTIELLNLEEAKVVKKINTLDDLEYNQF